MSLHDLIDHGLTAIMPSRSHPHIRVGAEIPAEGASVSQKMGGLGGMLFLGSIVGGFLVISMLGIVQKEGP